MNLTKRLSSCSRPLSPVSSWLSGQLFMLIIPTIQMMVIDIMMVTIMIKPPRYTPKVLEEMELRFDKQRKARQRQMYS